MELEADHNRQLEPHLRRVCRRVKQKVVQHCRCKHMSTVAYKAGLAARAVQHIAQATPAERRKQADACNDVLDVRFKG